LWARHSFFKSPARNQSFLSESSVLRREVHHTASPGLGILSTRSHFWKKNQTAISSPAPCTVKTCQGSGVGSISDRPLHYIKHLQTSDSSAWEHKGIEAVPPVARSSLWNPPTAD